MFYRMAAGQTPVVAIAAVLLLTIVGPQGESAEFQQRVVKQWYPSLEWRIDDVTVGDDMNPFDVVASVVFEHDESGETIRTGMFHDGAGTWKFRFTGTKVGRWSFETSCADAAELDGLSGTVEVEQNDDAVLGRGFVTSKDHQWMWSGNGRAFVPQLVMGPSIHIFMYHLARSITCTGSISAVLVPSLTGIGLSRTSSTRVSPLTGTGWECPSWLQTTLSRNPSRPG